MLHAELQSYPPASWFHSGVGETDLFAAIRQSNDDPIPRRLAIGLGIPAGPPAEVEADFARLRREVGLIAPLVDSDREVIEFHCGVGQAERPFPARPVSGLVAALRQQFRFSSAAERGFKVDAGDSGVTQEDIGLLVTSGFNRIEFTAGGLSTRIVHAARSEGFRSIGVRVVLSAGRPTATALLSMLDFALELRPDRLIVPVEPPDSRLTSDWAELARERLDRAGYLFIGPNCFTLPHDDLALALQTDRLQFSPLGYSPRWDCDLLGIGIGSISQVGDCLSQNNASLAGWRQAIDSGHLPVQRGYRLTADDELRADLVGQLLCRRMIAIDEVERDHGIGFRRHFASELARLAPCFATGLVVDRGDRIEVGSRAWPWLRNIALCFYASESHCDIPQGTRLRH